MSTYLSGRERLQCAVPAMQKKMVRMQCLTNAKWVKVRSKLEGGKPTSLRIANGTNEAFDWSETCAISKRRAVVSKESNACILVTHYICTLQSGAEVSGRTRVYLPQPGRAGVVLQRYFSSVTALAGRDMPGVVTGRLCRLSAVSGGTASSPGWLMLKGTPTLAVQN